MVCQSGSDDDGACDGLMEKRKEKDSQKKKKKKKKEEEEEGEDREAGIEIRIV